jgi:drug/metabolite transporter (DMT)-like permease
MIYVLLSVCCSVIVSILLKLARRYEIDVYQAIGFNYAAAALLCYWLFKPDLTNLDSSAPISIYMTLGFLLPTIFVVMAFSVRYAGIVRTDIAQRLSLLIPLLAAYLFFGEQFSTVKTGAISLGLLAVLLSISWDKNASENKHSWLFPSTVFLGFGLIDVLLKQIATFKNLPFTTALFVIFLLALGISMLSLIYLVLLKKMRITVINLICGLILGVFNFGNIYFYLKAHQALQTQPSVVFTAMNIGVIALGSIVGLLLFKEKLSKLNYAGILLAILAILIIALN